jgi:hypothetical protein
MNNLLATQLRFSCSCGGAGLMSISPNALSGWAALMGSLAKTLDVKMRDGNRAGGVGGGRV